MNPIKVGIFGGSFNPPHIGHLAMADLVLHELGLSKVYFVPAGHSPHKPPFRDSSSSERRQMTSLAISDNPQFSLIDWELEKSGPSYTLMTVRRLMEEEKLSPHEIGVIIGEDLLGRLHEWHRFEELCSLVTWVILRRSSERVEKGRESLFSGVDFRYLSVDNIFLPVSSSTIRELIKSRKSFRYLVPQKVYAYIQQNSLYCAAAASDKTETLRKKPT